MLERERSTVSEANGSAGSGGGYRSVTSMLGTGFLFILGALGSTVEAEGRTRAMTTSSSECSYQNVIRDLQRLSQRDPERVAKVRQTNETSQQLKKKE